MTKCGIICTCVIIIIAMAALVICSVRGEKGGKPSQSLRDSKLGMSRAAHASECSPKGGAKKGPKTVVGTPYEPGPLVFRRGEAKIVTCTAVTDLRQMWLEGLWSAKDPEAQRKAGIRYAKQELAARLADQALAAGGIRFFEEGGTLRAELRAMVGEEAAE